jgi:hypothetical protein
MKNYPISRADSRRLDRWIGPLSQWGLGPLPCPALKLYGRRGIDYWPYYSIYILWALPYYSKAIIVGGALLYNGLGWAPYSIMALRSIGINWTELARTTIIV